MRNSGEPVVVPLNTVEFRFVKWLWRGYIPLGKLTVLDGDPGCGKSTVALDLAARVSTHSPMPDGSASDLEGPAGAVLLVAEDDLASTILPRLMIASAECSRIVALTGIRERQSQRDGGDGPVERLPHLFDFDALEQAIEDAEARLLVIDPFMAYLPPGRNANYDHDVRSVLAPLARLAEERETAVLLIRHLRKGEAEKALYRGQGSIGISAAARTALLAAPDPDDPHRQRRVLAVTKSNLAAIPQSLVYRLEDVSGFVRVVWDGPSPHTAEDLLRRPIHQRAPQLVKAMEFLERELASGPRSSTELEEAAGAEGISLGTLRRAKEALGVRSVKTKSGWCWALETNLEVVEI